MYGQIVWGSSAAPIGVSAGFLILIRRLEAQVIVTVCSVIDKLDIR
jgi:hypothetical protein